MTLPDEAIGDLDWDDTPEGKAWRKEYVETRTGCALGVGKFGKVGKVGIGKLFTSRFFRKNIFSRFPSEAGHGYSFFRGSFKFMTHHTQYHGHHMQLEVFGAELRIPRPASWDPRTWF